MAARGPEVNPLAQRGAALVFARAGDHIRTRARQRAAKRRQIRESDPMQTRSKFFDDVSKLMTNAAGVAQGVKDEAETVVRARVERWLAESDLVTREEFDAVRDMAAKAREENERLAARLAALEAKLGE